MKFTLKKSGKESPAHHIIGTIYDRQFAGPKETSKGGRFVYYTREYATVHQWNDGQLRKGHEALRRRLNDISSAAAEYILTNRRNLTREGLKAHLDALSPKEKQPLSVLTNPAKTLVNLWSDYLQSINGTINPRTFNSYSNSFETTSVPGKDTRRKGVNFREFLKSKFWENIMPEEFTATHYNYYHSYLKKGVKPNTAAKRLKHLKQFLTFVVDDLKLPVGFDVNKITFKETAGMVRISLTKEQLTAYETADLPEHLHNARDLAVVQCHTCLRVSDLLRVSQNIDGDKIKLNTKKTGRRVEVPISPQVRAILEKHNYQLPELSEQEYRIGIKAIHRHLFPNDTMQVRDGEEFKEVYVHEEISSHDMVRTWINLSLQDGMPVSEVAQISGKSFATIQKNYHVPNQASAEKSYEKIWGRAPLKVAR